MKIIADLQIHSRFSRAVSKQMTLPNISWWADRKGIDLVATGDWTHPMWFREIERDLEELGNGLLRLKKTVKESDHVKEYSSKKIGKNDPLFLLATEVSSIYTQDGKGRRVHTLIWVPTLDSARKISQQMTKQGCNLLSDGRPIIPLSTINVAELVYSIEPTALVFPSHAWTPWFSTYGGKSGFDSIDEAYGEFAKYVCAVETGLSSDPSMNWQIKELDTRNIVSFSDSHSGPKLGREATVFEIPDGKLSYDAIYEAVRNPHTTASVADENSGPSSEAGSILLNQRDSKEPSFVKASAGKTSEAGQNFIRSPQSGEQITANHKLPTTNRIAYTIEFHPEEGKYHFTGHRACNVRYGPSEVKEKGTSCPVCGKPLTQGVVQRVEELAGRDQKSLQLTVHGSSASAKSTADRQLINIAPEVKFTCSKAFPSRPPFVMLVPLQEIIAESIGSPVTSNKTKSVYFRMTDVIGSEFDILLSHAKDDIAKVGGERVAEGIEKVRSGNIVVDPGYDGVFGVVKIWGDGEKLVDKSKEQLTIF